MGIISVHVTWLLVALTFGARVASKKTDFRCPEEFGYYPHSTDCSLYYVCVFGGPLLESCTGGLVYSEDLQTCDWPRNVACNRGQEEKANLIDGDSLNVHIDYKKNSEPSRVQSSREPRRQSQDSAEENILERSEVREDQRSLTNQRTEVEAEILRNIDLEEPEVIDSLRPQPSILSTVIDGVDRVISGEKHQDAIVGKSSFSSKPQFSSGQTYGEKSETEGVESKARDAGADVLQVGDVIIKVNTVDSSDHQMVAECRLRTELSFTVVRGGPALGA